MHISLLIDTTFCISYYFDYICTRFSLLRIRTKFDMPAPENNKNAETVTLESARELALLALSKVSNECFYLSTVAESCETYRQKFEYILKKFNDDHVVFNTIKRLYNKCESIVMEKTGNGDITPALGIFVLKAYHGLMETSKVEQDVTTGGEKLSFSSFLMKSNQIDDEAN